MIVINAVLMLFSTFIAVSLSLYLDTERKKREEANELKMVYISTARYVGQELANNIVRIEDILSNTEIALKKLEEDFPSIPEIAKIQQQAGAWQAVSEEIVVGLEDVNYRSLIMSGILTKISDYKIITLIDTAYSKMMLLKQQARRLSIFMSMVISLAERSNGEAITKVLKPESIEILRGDISAFIVSARMAIEQVNLLVKPLNMEVTIIEEN